MEHKLKILVVDDDLVDRIAVRRSLKKAGLQVDITEAYDCASAIATLQNNNFDCIFLDYRLPDEDGLRLVQKLQTIGVEAPLIVLTGQGDEQIAVELMKAGASDYLSKSKVSPATLSHIMQNAIRLRKAEMEAELATQKLRETNELLIHQNQELEKQRKQIELQNQKLKEVSRLKSEFLAIMSHELRTPMNAVMGFSQMLMLQRHGSLSSKQKEMVERIFNNGQNLLTLLNEVLDFSKIESGNLHLYPEEFDLAALATITTEELRSLAMAKNLTLQVRTQLDNPLVINDRACVRRILVNLISNAIKFTDRGGVWVEVITISPQGLAYLQEERYAVRISIQDTGIGISEENLRNIFEAFRQADQSITRRHSGTGLGLAITDSLVKMMKGRIKVESKLGEGSIFHVDLPRQIER
ncbi:MAG: ATP-binding protein [Prochloraceae cyanobacterium]